MFAAIGVALAGGSDESFLLGTFGVILLVAGLAQHIERRLDRGRAAPAGQRLAEGFVGSAVIAAQQSDFPQHATRVAFGVPGAFRE